MKEKYIKPCISLTKVIMESSISAGSAFVYPGNDQNGSIYDEWTEGNDDERTIDW